MFQFALPSIHLPSFSLGKLWAKKLYGTSSANSVTVVKDQAVTLTATGFGFGCSLIPGGAVEFTDGKASLNVSAVGLDLQSAEIHKGANFATLFSTACEVGVSYGKKNVRHFFTLSQGFSLPDFTLKFKVCLS